MNVRRALLLSGAMLGGLASPASALDCIEVRTSAPYRNLGYDHIVHLRSRCEKRATCRVSTDVNPETITVQVPAKKSVDVLTFRGSPARTFKARVECAESPD